MTQVTYFFFKVQKAKLGYEACDVGDMRMVGLLLPVVENTALGVNCADGAGVTGLMAALEKARLEVVDRLLDHKDINMDFTQTDTRGRNALDLVILSPSNHFMHLILHGLRTDCIEKKQKLEKVLLPRLLSCVSLGKHGLGKFRIMLDFFNVNFKEGALLSFLIISGELMFLKSFKKMKDCVLLLFIVPIPQARSSSSTCWPNTASRRKRR